MKTLLLVFFFQITGTMVFSQTDTTAPFLKTKLLPAFILTNIDFVEFNQTILDDKKSTIIMLFNPECEHCQQQLDSLLATPQVTKSVQIILSSVESQEKNRVFYKKFHLEKYSYVHLGKDYSYFFGKYFQPHAIPFLAFYNPQKQLVYFSQGIILSKTQIEDALTGKRAIN